jgi:hypothetical protein
MDRQRVCAARFRFLCFLSSSNAKVKLLFEARSLGSLSDLLMADDLSGQHVVAVIV